MEVEVENDDKEYSSASGYSNGDCKLVSDKGLERRKISLRSVEARPHGPVVPELYQVFKAAGRNPIFFLGGYLGSYSVYAGKLETNLEKIWKTYKKHSGISLSNATHHPGEPWRVVAESCDVRSKPPIPNDTIAGIFRKKVEKISNEENSQDC